MILLNYKNCNTFSEKDVNNFDIDQKIEILTEYIDEYENDINYGYMECPVCKSTRLISYGSYKRNIGIFNQYFEITIKRVMCKDCNHTHALIPSFILPYYQNEVSFIGIVVKKKSESGTSTNQISKDTNINRQLINKWVKRFKEHVSRVKSTNSNNIEEAIKGIFRDVFLREKYQFINGLRFLARIPT